MGEGAAGRTIYPLADGSLQAEDVVMEQFFGSPLFLLVFVGTFIFFLARPLWQMWNVYAGAPKRRQHDASRLGLQPPAELWPFLAELQRLGFKRLGESQLDLPGIRAVEVYGGGNPHARTGGADRHTVFAFIDEGATVMAETGLVRGGPTLISFNTTFADGSVVETMYPRGESIHDPDFHSGHNSVSLAAAYAEQQLEIDRWRMHHGTPRLIHDMADYLRADADYRERFSKRKLRRPFLLYQLLPIVLVVGVVLVVLSILAGFWPL